VHIIVFYILHNMTYAWLIALLILILLVIYILNLSVFGKYPSKQTLQRIKQLPNYGVGQIDNQTFTPNLPEGISYWDVIKKIIKGNKNGTPSKVLPYQKPDFSSSNKFKIIWFGHSSYLILVDGKNILVDPVFSERTSPFQFLGARRFAGTDFVKPDDFPNLDVILITHDHYDHLDYHSILKLKSKTTHFVTSLGVGAHLIHWGIPENQITELAWGETTSPFADFHFTAAPARHFSGRLFKRNQTAWSSFILKTSANCIYLGGDSGYDHHFKTIGETYGPFDLAILECGQYNTMWPFIHMFPDQVVQAALDLRAKILMPVHWGKYKLAMHDWDEPIKQIVLNANSHNIPLATPQLGETFVINREIPTSHWWVNL